MPTTSSDWLNPSQLATPAPTNNTANYGLSVYYQYFLRDVLPVEPGSEIIDSGIHHWRAQPASEFIHVKEGKQFNAGPRIWKLRLTPTRVTGTDRPKEYTVSFFMTNTTHWSGAKSSQEDTGFSMQFIITVANIHNPRIFVAHVTKHRFSASQPSYSLPISMDILSEPRRAFPGNNFKPIFEPQIATSGLVISVFFRVLKEPENNLWKFEDIRGIRNLGRSGGVASLLQSLFHLRYFRKAVYKMRGLRPTSPPLALQRLFFQLQTSSEAASLLELSQAIGWSRFQHYKSIDLWKFTHNLYQMLNHWMVGTTAEGTMDLLFKGRLRRETRCIFVEHSVSNLEDFSYLRLDTSGERSLVGALSKFTRRAKLEDDERYYVRTNVVAGLSDHIPTEPSNGAPATRGTPQTHANQPRRPPDRRHTLRGRTQETVASPQEAWRTVSFLKLPSVLQLHLDRKAATAFHYPLILDMGPYLDQSVRPASSPVIPERPAAAPVLPRQRTNYRYHLHSVIVHSPTGDHHYAFVRPSLNVASFSVVTPSNISMSTLPESTRAALPRSFDNPVGSDRQTYGNGWLRLDDVVVKEVEGREAFEQNFPRRSTPKQVEKSSDLPLAIDEDIDDILLGDENTNPKFPDYVTMLVYISEQDLVSVMQPVGKGDLPNEAEMSRPWG